MRDKAPTRNPTVRLKRGAWGLWSVEGATPAECFQIVNPE